MSAVARQMTQTLTANMWRAADLMRDDPQFTPAFRDALADWIEGHARDWASSGSLTCTDSPGDVQQALAVATAYLGT